MTEPKYTNEACPLYGSEYCTALNMENCEKCTVDLSDEEKTERVKRDIEDMAALLPDGGMAPLFVGDECLLCRGEKGKKEYYAMFDLGHGGKREHRAKGLIGALKKEPRFGSLLPAQLGCCKECKKRITRLSYIKGIIISAFLVSGIVTLSLRSVNEPLMAITHGLPFYIFVLWVLIGLGVSELGWRTMKRNYEKKTYLDIMQAPELKELSDKGWFELFAERGVSKLVFSKKGANRGLFMAMPEELSRHAENDEGTGEKTSEKA